MRCRCKKKKESFLLRNSMRAILAEKSFGKWPTEEASAHCHVTFCGKRKCEGCLPAKSKENGWMNKN
ncbi:uncharacterized protein MONOS_17338 [Monocercomonoides exilis]|uniref:uncharacterized protein n=1 Tax=Monocercomonoides exilis TaxID=2049356 RepID=UPI003559A022|nr:hypothetical protein MONOS_17338 [Monocercomonoides exilis]